MSNFKGTKGKWELNKAYQTITDCKGFGIAQENGIRNSNEWKANAQLIAHAPEMLEMLEAKIYYLDNGSLSFYEKYNYNADELSTKIRELIKKATEI